MGNSQIGEVLIEAEVINKLKSFLMELECVSVKVFFERGEGRREREISLLKTFNSVLIILIL